MEFRRYLAAAAIILLPLAATQLLLTTVLKTNITHLIPAWSDEVVYWHSALTFQHAGFNGGYYTFAELPARAGFSHFDTHGQDVPHSVYASFARARLEAGTGTQHRGGFHVYLRGRQKR
ncbi:MAG: hypothetical protein HZC41_06225 [Chloroflexi bacterium]|nr:hypothetical protein [Chloroflexota bacterium]